MRLLTASLVLVTAGTLSMAPAAFAAQGVGTGPAMSGTSNGNNSSASSTSGTDNAPTAGSSSTNTTSGEVGRGTPSTTTSGSGMHQ